MPSDQQSQVVRRARGGEYRLLYLSPERLARPDTIGWLQRVPIAFFAIDEAHCISEWGHEFRPEYRQLSALRQHFPDSPIAAFTASATRHVRHDILQQLQLREPDKYIVSFHRPNLRYLVRECDSRAQPRLLIKALRAHARQQRDRLRPDHCPSGRNSRLPRRPRDCGCAVPRQDGHRQAPAQPGTLDVR
jgi:ATP-dependent DNA helicase RecQ